MGRGGVGPEQWRPNEKDCRVKGTDKTWKDGGKGLRRLCGSKWGKVGLLWRWWHHMETTCGEHSAV